ncbi:hypothetical protein [Embleya sp. AB8]|uniref:hypothetical protein n=1 Tax=Embleya sp. AB8 TaxID=3156304 RepID=UPI003C785485
MTDDEFDDMDRIREHFARPGAAARETAEYLAARREAARRASRPPPLDIVPAPEFPRFGVARYSCPRRCGWWHDEPTDPGPTRLILPTKPGADPEASRLADLVDLDEPGAAISLDSESRLLALRSRVAAAIEEHYARAH